MSNPSAPNGPRNGQVDLIAHQSLPNQTHMRLRKVRHLMQKYVPKAHIEGFVQKQKEAEAKKTEAEAAVKP